MTVLDVGAHHGLYTLLASKCVGRNGRVIAFEPSFRERRRLKRHLRYNPCANVEIQPCALGDHNGEADLYLVEGMHDWCNSLRTPNVEERTSKVRVEVRRLDDVLEGMNWPRVDFIKLDVEGGELSFLHGARKMLCGDMRPAILVEVQDIRTVPWGYAARDIVRFLSDAGYSWSRWRMMGRWSRSRVSFRRTTGTWWRCPMSVLKNSPKWESKCRARRAKCSTSRTE